MIEFDNHEVLADALSLWGPEAQTDQAIEEMAELTQALLHMRRADRANPKAVQEEIADVLICLQQLTILFGQDEVHDFFEEKTTRLKKRIAKARDSSLS